MGDKAKKYPFFARHAETIVNNGYSIVAVLPETKRPRFQNWHAACFKDTEPSFLSRHVRRCPEDSIGIACGTKVIAIDIDETDLNRANEIYRLSVEILGDTPLIRYGQFPKRTLVYRAGEPIDSVKVGKMEVLGRSAKFMAFGIHPVTQKPYYWQEDSPTDTDLQSLPAIDRRGVEKLVRRVQRLIPREKRLVVDGKQEPSPSHTRKFGLSESKRQGLESRIVRDETNRVTDGREAYLTQLTWEEYGKGYRDVNVLTNRVWTRFANTADLARPKGSSPRARYQLKDARTKAKLIVKKSPAIRHRQRRQQSQVVHLHSLRHPGYWTAERKRRHQGEAAVRGLAPSRLIVNQAMLDATPVETGQCGATVPELMRTTGLSVSAVKSTRRDLVGEGLWIVERSVYIPAVVDALDADLEKEDGLAQAA